MSISKFKAGFYECDITPPLGCFVPGNYNNRRAVEVYDRLYAKAFVIESDGNCIAFLSVDTCSVPEDMHSVVTERITAYTGIPAENVCISSNHTHTGAPVSDAVQVNGYHDSEYLSVFFRLAADAVILAYNRLDEADISFAASEAKGISFNRSFILKDGSYISLPRKTDLENIAEPLADIDTTVSVLFAERDGKRIGALINYALHQDTVHPDRPGYSGDYSSELSKLLKKEYGDDFVSVFNLGTCGDINHVDINNYDAHREFFNHRPIGKVLADAVITADNNKTPVCGSVGAVKEFVALTKRKISFDDFGELSKKYFDEGHLYKVENLAVYYRNVTSDTDDVYVQALRVGDVAIYALPGEIFVDFGFEIKKRSQSEKCIVIENCNSYLGYIPTEKAFEPNSNVYEIATCKNSCHMPDSGSKLVNKALELGNRL